MSKISDIDNNVSSAERSRLISRKREKIFIDQKRDYPSEALEKYSHFYNWLNEYALSHGGVSALGRQLASETHISVGTFSRLFNNENAKINIYFIAEICKCLDVSLDEVFDLHPGNITTSNFRYDLVSYISLLRNYSSDNEEYVPVPVENCHENSNLEADSYSYLCGCIDREVNFVCNALLKLSDRSDSNDSLLLNRLLPYRILLTRRDYTNPTSQLAEAMHVRKELLSFRRMCQHAPRIDTVLTFCLIYDISLDALVDSRFAFDEIKDTSARNLMRKVSVLDYNVCGVLSKIAILEREGHENLSNGLVSNSSVSNKKLKTSFEDELKNKNL